MRAIEVLNMHDPAARADALDRAADAGMPIWELCFADPGAADPGGPCPRISRQVPAASEAEAREDGEQWAREEGCVLLSVEPTFAA